jgi:MoxR-like ATPase
LLNGRFHVTPDDVRALLPAVLRHRVLLSYRAEAEGITVDQLVGRLLEGVPAP